MNRKELFASIQPEISRIITGTTPRESKLAQISGLLHDTFSHYDWVGFYLVDPNADQELILGPFVGEETEHTRIKFGVGICGQSAATHKTFLVDDVTKEDNYLACSTAVKSEIVVPVLVDGEFVAELDIDSHLVSAMTEIDKEELEFICSELAKNWN